jgi:hypothetical protein
MEIFLDDRLEKCVQKTDIEVLLQNDEEMGVYLNGRYEFDIKAELINAVYSASPSDGFVTKLQDAVSLLSEPVIFESLVVEKNENVGKFLRLVLEEVYTPLVAADQRLVELEHALEDVTDVKSTGSIIEFATMKDNEEYRTMLLFDVIETLFTGDMELKQDYETTILEHVLNFMNDSRKALLIDYHLGEVMQIFLNMGESFRHQYAKTFNQVNEPQVIQFRDASRTDSTKSVRSLKDAYMTALDDTYRLCLVKNPENITETQHVSVIDRVLHQYDVFKKTVNDVIQATIHDQTVQHLTTDHMIHSESMPTGSIDTALSRDITAYFQTHENAPSVFIERVGHSDITAQIDWQEDKAVLPEDVYYNLFKHLLRDPNRYPILERKEQEFMHDLRDMFFLDGTDEVNYAVGDMEDGWPLGVFKLGVNTLRGEVQTS